MTGLSIRWRLTLWYGAALALILLLFSGATYWLYRAAALRAFDTDLVNNLGVLESEMIEEIGEARAALGAEEAGRQPAVEIHRHAATAALSEFRLNALYAEIRQGSRGEALLAGLPGAGLARGAQLVPASTWRDVARSPATRIVALGPRVHAAIRSFRPAAESEPILIAVADRTTLVDQTLASIRTSLLEFGIAGLFLALGGGYWLATRALLPIDAMTTQAGRLAGAGAIAGSRRLDVAGRGDELERLALTFNRLLERVEASVTQMKDFVADAAHELKTPVSIVRTEAELSLSADRSAGEYRETLQAIARESERLSNLVLDLTLLAEGQNLEHPLERRLVDLNELLQEIARSLRGLAVRQGIAVEIESSGCVEYRGDERLLRQIFTNLVENAIKFSRPGGRVAIVLEAGQDAIDLRVLDEAPTLGPEDRERVFERFYRTQRSRSRETSGSGLGLAIVRWAVTLHGGQVHVEEREAGGNVFVVRLPSAGSRPSDVR